MVNDRIAFVARESGGLTFSQALREIRANGLPNELAEAKGRLTMAEDIFLILEQVWW